MVHCSLGRSLKPSAAVTSPVDYVRVHGRNYGDWFRAEDVYVLTNNHNLGKAGVNALQRESMLTHETVAAPPTLMASYPEALAGYVKPE